MELPNNKIIITGASGYVGSGLFRDLRKKYETIGTYHSTSNQKNLVKIDITNKKDVDKLVTSVKPTVIIHAGSIGSLKWCQDNPTEARQINEEGTRNVLEAANKIGSNVILISSFAAKNPDNVYAETKAKSEELLKKIVMDGIIIRPTVVFGISPNTENDKLMNRILKNITQKTDPTYDNTWKIQPTDLGHMAQVISAVIDKRITSQTIPVVTEKLVSYFDIANDILPHFGIEPKPKEGEKYPFETDDRSKLFELGLPLIEYNEMIKKCIRDIKNIYPRL